MNRVKIHYVLNVGMCLYIYKVRNFKLIFINEIFLNIKYL